jgi:starch phosphorylase
VDFEGHIEGYTGWVIGPSPTETKLIDSFDNQDAEDLYHKLEHVIIPRFYNERGIWLRMMQNAFGKNAYYFNTH